MYKLLIVEDEEIFRRVLPTIIDWGSIGFEVIGVCENGFKALEFLYTADVDAIMTDIRMPVFNGLELAMEVKSRFPRTRVTLLSAFNEFDYARKALECGVYGYILKSDGEEEIIEHFTRLKNVLDQEELQNRNSEDYWRKRELLFKQIITGNPGSQVNMAETFGKSGLFGHNQECRVALLRIDELKHMTFYSGPDRVRSLIEEIRTYLYEHVEIRSKGTVITLQEMFCIIIYMQPGQEQLQAFREVYLQLKEETDAELSCVIGEKAANVEELCLSYNRAKVVLQHAYVGNDWIENGSVPSTGGNQTLTFMEEERLLKDMLLLVKGKQQEPLIEYLEALQRQLTEARLSEIGRISGFAVKLVLALVNELGEMGKKPEAMLEKANSIIKEIGCFETLAMVFKRLEAFVVEAFELLNEENGLKNRRIVDEALDYIHKHYAGQLSLEGLARHLNVHPVHVSRLFSKDLKKTFKTILTEVRMEEAKRLLKDINYRVYEISSLVGYEKPRYFSELFRSVTGLTPLEYRERYKG
jgi:two-component system, response regulator YesN